MVKYTTPVNQFLKSIDIQPYDRYLPNAFNDSLSLLEKVNKVIYQLQESNQLTNEVVQKWNEFAEWVNKDGLDHTINEKIGVILSDDSLINLIDTQIMSDFKNQLNQITDEKITKTNKEILKIEKKTPQVSVEEYSEFVVNDDWTVPIQKAIDYVQTSHPNFPLTGGEIIFPTRLYKFNQIKISEPHIRLMGTGVLNGNVLIKSVDELDPLNFTIKSLFTIIDGLRFIGVKGNTLTDAITIQNTRDVTIKNCYFENFRYGVYGEAIRDDFKWQQTARVRIESCTFIDCLNMIKTKWLPWYEGISSAWVYHQHGDWTIRGCYFYDNHSKCEDMINMCGQDGLICSGNYFFHGTASGKSPIKRNNIYLKQTNFVIISENNFFEAGSEAIKCDDPRTLTIQNNNIAWCGQRTLSSAIFVEITDTSAYSGAVVTISNNTINGTTQHGILIGNNIINAMVTNNTMIKEGENPHYYGEVPLNSIQHFSIYVRQPGIAYPEQEQVYVSNNMFSKPMFQQRGVNANNGYMSFVKANRTFGNIVIETKIINGVTSISESITINSNPFNNTYPYIFKGWEGNVNKITGGKTGQIITILVNTVNKTLLVTHSSSPGENDIVLKNGVNKTLTQFEPITLQKTDNFWLEI